MQTSLSMYTCSSFYSVDFFIFSTPAKGVGTQERGPHTYMKVAHSSGKERGLYKREKKNHSSGKIPCTSRKRWYAQDSNSGQLAKNRSYRVDFLIPLVCEGLSSFGCLPTLAGVPTKGNIERGVLHRREGVGGSFIICGLPLRKLKCERALHFYKWELQFVLYRVWFRVQTCSWQIWVSSG